MDFDQHFSTLSIDTHPILQPMNIQLWRHWEEDQGTLFLDGTAVATFFSNGNEIEDPEQHLVVIIQGAIFDLKKFSCSEDLATSVFLSHGEVEAVSPFYISDNYHDPAPLNKELIKELGGMVSKPRVLYLDKIVVHHQIASSNLGFIACAEFCRLIFDFIGASLPVVSYLGAYDDTLNGSTVVRYFEQCGFLKLNRVSWCLSHYRIQEATSWECAEIAVRSRGRKRKRNA